MLVAMLLAMFRRWNEDRLHDPSARAVALARVITVRACLNEHPRCRTEYRRLMKQLWPLSQPEADILRESYYVYRRQE